MKTRLHLILIYLVFTNSYSQFDEHIIEDSNTIEKAHSVSSTDLDGDGDLDILCASLRDDIIFWYENTDGLGTFGSKIVISTTVNEPRSVSAADIDGDGDLDVISASKFDNKIAWYENTDGLGAFGSQQIIEIIPGSANILAVDLDGDNDLDIVSGAIGNPGEISWNKNTDGLGTFDARQIITTSLDQLADIFATDLDGDGDIDLLSASTNDNKIAWYENTDGLGTFGAQQIITSSTTIDGASSVFASDIDGDGDMDVISTSWLEDKVAWYENTSGLGNFGPQQIISLITDSFPIDAYPIDIDQDGDMDIVAALWEGDMVVWFENTDGLGGFGSEQIIADGTDAPFSVYSGDIDGDGDMDVISGHDGFSTGKVVWYENNITLSINDDVLIGLSFFPNPVRDIITIETSKVVNYTIVNSIGQVMNSGILEVGFNDINLERFTNGLYFLNLETSDGISSKKIIKQ